MRDLRYILKHTFNETAKALSSNGLLFIVISASLIFVSSTISNIFSSGMGYIINYFIQILILSVLAKVLNNIVTTNKVPTQDLKYYLEHYFINIMNTYFVLYVFKIIYNMLGVYFVNMPIAIKQETRIMIYVILLFIIEEIILGSLLESVYIDGLGGLNAYKRALSFIKDNIVEWTIISAPYLILRLAETGVLTNYYLLPVWARGLTALILPILLLFRGKAYLLLSQSTKRKRKFMMEYDK